MIFANKSIIYHQIRLCQLLLKIWQNEEPQNNTFGYDRKIELDFYGIHDYAQFMFIKNFLCFFEILKFKIGPFFRDTLYI